MSSTSKWRSPGGLAAIGVAATFVLAVAVVMALVLSGGAEALSRNAPLIAALVALGGVFTAQMVSIALEDRRAQEARNLETQRTRAAALQTYFEQVGKLLIEQPLRQARPGDNLSTVVRAQTVAVLEGLDSTRKGIVLLFLSESHLISKGEDKIVALNGANLRDADLRDLHLRAVALDGAYLQGANLRRAYLKDADLGGTGLSGADLTNANLSGASLINARLQARRSHHLSAANLSGANLSGANLSGAKGITNEDLERQAYSLEGAIMPDGSKHP
jgi:hypothetical protein